MRGVGEGLGAGGPVDRPQRPYRPLDGLGRVGGDDGGGRPRGVERAARRGQLGDQPVSYARRAEIRSAAPMRAIRATSPYGIFRIMWTVSKALTIP